MWISVKSGNSPKFVAGKYNNELTKGTDFLAGLSVYFSNSLLTAGKSNGCLCCEKGGTDKYCEDKRSKSSSERSFFDGVGIMPKEAGGGLWNPRT
jgi:hypothetical protein